MSDLYPAPLGEFETWSRVLRASGRHDFYHLREYHEQAAWNGEGEPVLLVYRDPPYEIALPLLIRPLDGCPGQAGSAPAGTTPRRFTVTRARPYRTRSFRAR